MGERTKIKLCISVHIITGVLIQDYMFAFLLGRRAEELELWSFLGAITVFCDYLLTHNLIKTESTLIVKCMIHLTDYIVLTGIMVCIYFFFLKIPLTVIVDGEYKHGNVQMITWALISLASFIERIVLILSRRKQNPNFIDHL